MSNHKYIIKSINKPASDIVVLELKHPNGKPVFNFKPGQYVMISYKNEKGGMENQHTFSISSSPTEKDHIQLGIKILGNFTQKLSKMKVGDEIFVSGGYGNFYFNDKKHQNIIFFAGGIGITPFYSAMQYATDRNLSNKISLVYSNKTVSGTIFFKEIKELEEKNKNIKTLFSITEEKIPSGVAGVINERVDKTVLQSFIGPVKGKTFMICGPVSFMNGIKENLLAIGANKSQIHIEEFTMIPDSGFWAGTKNMSYAMGFSAVAMLLPFYFVYNSAHGATALQDLISNTIFGSANVENAKNLALDNLAKTQNNPNPISFNFNAIKSGLASLEPKAIKDVVKNISNVAYAKTTPKAKNNTTLAVEAPKPKTETSAAKTEAQTASTALATSAPTPTTSTSATHTTTPTQATTQANSTNNPTPTPTTSASIPASETSSTPSAPTVTSSTNTQSPIPTTSASIPASEPTTPTAPVVSQPTPTTPQPVVPTPITSASGVVIQPTPVSPIVINPTPTPTQPAPITSASGVIIQPMPSPIISAPTQPSIPSPITSPSGTPIVTNPTPPSPVITNPVLPNPYSYDSGYSRSSRYERDDD